MPALGGKLKILVTGGAGFIGSNFIEYLINKYSDYDIINLDALTYAGNLDNLKEIQGYPRYTFIHGRIEDDKLVDRIMAGIDVVVNFAAESHVDRSILAPRVFLTTNIIGTHTLLEAALRYKVKLFFQISTDEVYGALKLGTKKMFSEKSQLHPNSPYSASKTSAELLAQAYYTTYGLPIIISRCSNNYGPKQHPEKFIPTVILNALRDKPVPIYGDGLYVRDWIHVLDHCRAIDVIIHKGSPGEVYNIGAGEQWANINLAKIILKILDKPESLLTSVKDRPGHDRRYAIDSTKLQKNLGWKPAISLEKGLVDTVQWYINKAKSRQPA